MNKKILVLGLAVMLLGVLVATMRADINIHGVIDETIYLYRNFGLVIILMGFITSFIGLEMPKAEAEKE